MNAAILTTTIPVKLHRIPGWLRPIHTKVQLNRFVDRAVSQAMIRLEAVMPSRRIVRD
jgi:hypothetical protein